MCCAHTAASKATGVNARVLVSCHRGYSDNLWVYCYCISALQDLLINPLRNL